MTSANTDLALVMAGGGARAAYQVGFLRCIARRYPDLNIPIITGTSAGALNAVFLANHTGRFRDKVEDLAAIWAGLTPEQIFRVDPYSIARSVLAWGLRVLMGKASRAISVRSLLDSSPLHALLERVLRPVEGRLLGIEHNLSSGNLKALAITASNYYTAQSVTWVQGKEIVGWERAHRVSVLCPITLNHVLASASLPFFFQAECIDGHWYGDGGMLLTAPLSPAIHLGASRILAISTHVKGSASKPSPYDSNPYPPPAQIAGALYNTIFLDMFDPDTLRLERINELVVSIPESERRGLRPVNLTLFRPSRNLGELANPFEPKLPPAFRFMTRGLGTKETRCNDLLSLLMFQPDYLRALIDMGCTDAEARQDEIAALLSRF
jgi:NTE family protein